MAMTVTMPQLGETVTEGTILRWAKQVGDSIAADEVLVEISTDKVDTEVPSPAAGVISEILVNEGETVEVGTAIAIIGDAGAEPATDDGAQPAEAAASEPTPEPATATVAASEPAEAVGAGAAEAGSDPSHDAGSDTGVATEETAAHGAGEGEATTVTMPQLGETVTEGTILRWAKQVGDSIAADEVLVEISTDKVDTEVPSPAAGVISEILVNEGETVEVGTAIAVIGGAGRPAAEAAPEQPMEQPVEPRQSPEPSTAQPTGPAPEAAPAAPDAPAASTEPSRTDTSGLLLSPVVRKLVRENEVDLSLVSGTGEGGRITRKDVEQHIAERGSQPPEQPGPEPPAGPLAAPPAAPLAAPPAAEPEPEPQAAPPAAEPASEPEAAPSPAQVASPKPPTPAPAASGDETVELDRLRVRIGQNMIKAKQTAAHVWTSVEVDFERVERIRSAHKAAFKAEEGFSLTYLPFIARATIDALGEYPVVNSSFYLEEKTAVFHRSVNLGIAIDLDQKGLVVASIRNADGLRLVGIARQIRGLAEKARNNRLEPDDVTGSSFTITNPGPFGSFMSAPIINVPNTGILSTDTVTKRPAVVQGVDGEDVIAIRHIGYLGLSWDHRAFDGSTAVLFLQRIKQNIEHWDWEQELA